MSTFHSIVSRRDFMKGLGLAGAGLGGAALAAPVFHDLDELMTSPRSLRAHPWYVKERELLDPTTEVDWNIMRRYDRRYQGQAAVIIARYYGEAKARAAWDNQGAVNTQLLHDGTPGFGHKWQALRNALTQQHRWKATFTGPEPAVQGDKLTLAPTPEVLGVPKWQGSPEDNTRLLTAACRLFGAGELGFAELDSTWRNKVVALTAREGDQIQPKWIGTDPANIPAKVVHPIVYEDVPKPYYTDEKWVIPNAQRWVLFIEGPEPRETDRTALSRMAKSNLVSNAGIRNSAFFSTWNFFRGLGYECFGGIGHGTDCFNTGTTAILTGCAETARMSNWPLSISYGPRAYDLAQITDMPVEPTHPVDSGMWKFCQTCGLCAAVCPSDAIPKLNDSRYPDGPSFDMPLIEGKPDVQHAPGPKLFWFNGSACTIFWGMSNAGSGCSLCAANCAFSTGNEAVVHGIIRPTIATTSLLNGFFKSMSDTFGYGSFKDPEDWWDMSLPMLGIDTTVTALHGGYRK